MAKPQITIAFHAGEALPAFLDIVRESSAEESLRTTTRFAPGPVKGIFGALSKLAAALSRPVLVGVTNARLDAALREPSERKALYDGVAHGRLAPTPVAATGARLETLSPLEVADEVRLNADHWRRRLLAAPIVPPPRTESLVITSTADPARELEAVAVKDGALWVVDLAAIEREQAPEAALARLAKSLAARKDLAIAPPQTVAASWLDRMLREVLTVGQRAAVLPTPSEAEFDSARDAFPLELARALAKPQYAPRALAKDFDGRPATEIYAALDPKLKSGFLLRALAGGFGGGYVPRAEKLRAGFTLAHELLAALPPEAFEGAATPAEVALAATIAPNLEALLEREKAARSELTGSASIEDARKAKTRALRTLPKAGDPPPTRDELRASLQKGCLAAIACTEALADPAEAAAAMHQGS
jgi:hypothetical protein